MKACQSIKFNKENLKLLKENVFHAVYLYLLLHPEELEKDWVMSLTKSKKQSNNDNDIIHDVSHSFVYERLNYCRNTDNIIEMLQYYFPPIDDFFLFSTGEGDDMIMKWKPVVINDIDYNISVLYYEKKISSLMIFLMKEIENVIEENITSSPHIISLWYDWKDKKVEEIDTLYEIKLLISTYDVNRNNLSFSETVKEMFKSLYCVEEKFRVCYLTKNIVSIEREEEEKNIY